MHPIVEIKGLRGEDAKDKKATTYWVAGVNSLCTFGRWAFEDFTDICEIDSGFDELVSNILPEDVAA